MENVMPPNKEALATTAIGTNVNLKKTKGVKQEKKS